MNFQGKGTYSRSWDEKDIWRARLWTYYRLTEYVDRYIGMIIDALKESGEYDNTIIVFTSDHGDMSGSHRMGHKQCLYEECIRVPLIIRGPGIAAGQVDDTHIVDNCIDWMPTLCDVAGIETPEDCVGQSWKEILDGNEPADWRTKHVIESTEGLLLRNGNYKYMAYAQSPNHPEQLFDTENDPGEMNNLAKDPDYAAVMEECREHLAFWQKNHRWDT